MEGLGFWDSCHGSCTGLVTRKVGSTAQVTCLWGPILLATDNMLVTDTCMLYVLGTPKGCLKPFMF